MPLLFFAWLELNAAKLASSGAHMKCYIYKSARRAETYVYLAKYDHFALLPDKLQQQLGALSFVLELELSPQRRLAQADPTTVIANLSDTGYYLQLPPDASSGAEP